ncbi:hypothetical protein Y032_0245g3554 [Ancylostoma ceylanicum]|uniref:Uncharacterized protein n=1 Tax=Ancylostoma ceylanicum TaxID=53326 RepID=A0A016SD57_9BILA|nr:hypothetical protein Y032_0245g3554 [Ancylostoma ceylanicum]
MFGGQDALHYRNHARLRIVGAGSAVRQAALTGLVDGRAVGLRSGERHVCGWQGDNDDGDDDDDVDGPSA